MVTAKTISLGGSATWTTMAVQAPMTKLAAREETGVAGWKLRKLVIRVEDKNKQELSRTMFAE